MPSNTPLPAAQILALADAMEAHLACYHEDEIAIALAEAYRAARAASPRTLEEALILSEWNARKDPNPCSLIVARSEMQKHARRLAGEGGA